MTDELLSAPVAAQVLHDIDQTRSVEQWTYFLQNNRNKARNVPYRIPTEKIANTIFYRREELEKYVEWDRARAVGVLNLTGRMAEVVKAIGIGVPGGSSTGRQLNVTNVALQVDEDTHEPFIQIVLSNPLAVYRTDIAGADALAAELKDAVAAARRIFK